MGFRGYLFVVILVVFPTDAGSTCALDGSGYARCYSIKEMENLISRADEVRVLETECSGPEEFGDFSYFGNLSSLSIKNCENVTDFIGNYSVRNLKFLNFPSNNISIVPWQLFGHLSITTLDISNNPLNCDCRNLWLWEYLRRDKKTVGWDPHFVVGLPQEIKVDPRFFECKFSDCEREEAQADPLPNNLTLGKDVRLSCKVKNFSKKDILEGEWRWLLRDEADEEYLREGNLTKKSLTESDRMTMEIKHLTSHELGYVACVCRNCDRPVFDVFELKFTTNLTVALIEEENTDPHLVVHGFPLDSLNVTVIRIADNSTEAVEISKEKTSFFNETLIFKFQKDHSHFFAKYFDVFIRECALCPPRLPQHIDGDYSINVCRGDECAIAIGTFVNAKSSHPVITPFPSAEKENKSLFLVTFFLSLCVIILLIILSKTHFKHKLLKKGWEIKRRRASRNTDRTEETSIRLDDYSASSSINYIVQHVALIDKSNLQVKDRIGKGAFGEVHRADWMSKDLTIPVAMKMLFGIQLDSELDKEAALLSQLDHPNIVKLYGICRWDTQVALVMEMMNLGDLKSYVRDRTPRCENYSQFPAPLVSTELLDIAAQVAAGLCYLTSQQIVHRDLAARNCLVQGEPDLKVCNAAFRKPITVKISDFGMSRRLYSDGEYYKMQNGKTVLPVRWLPPECLSSGKFTHQSDMWSFGMVLFEIFSFGSVPFGDLSNSEVLTAVVSGMKPTLPSSFPEQINNLISQCWRNNPEERITAQEALNRLQLIR